MRRLPKSVIATLAGGVLFAAFGLIYGVAGYRSFISFEGLLIVLGGSVANAFLSYPREEVLKAFALIRELLKKSAATRGALHKDIMRLIAWAYVVQESDFLGLEKEAAKTAQEPLMRYGIDLVVTGYPAASIREMMRTAAGAEFERRTAPVTVLRNMAATAPAFGMVGTLVGMVTILHNAAADMTSVEGGLAIAMLSTLYGILAARLICLPAADKLLQQEEKEHFRNSMMTEGFALLAEKQKPFYVQDRLNSFLEPSRHIDLAQYMQNASRRQFALAA